MVGGRSKGSPYNGNGNFFTRVLRHQNTTPIASELPQLLAEACGFEMTTTVKCDNRCCSGGGGTTSSSDSTMVDKLVGAVRPAVLAALFICVSGGIYTDQSYGVAEDGDNDDGSWSYFVACWYWFVTVTTIGFGDFGPEEWGNHHSLIFTMVSRVE